MRMNVYMYTSLLYYNFLRQVIESRKWRWLSPYKRNYLNNKNKDRLQSETLARLTSNKLKLEKKKCEMHIVVYTLETISSRYAFYRYVNKGENRITQRRIALREIIDSDCRKIWEQIRETSRLLLYTWKIIEKYYRIFSKWTISLMTSINIPWKVR